MCGMLLLFWNYFKQKQHSRKYGSHATKTACKQDACGRRHVRRWKDLAYNQLPSPPAGGGGGGGGGAAPAPPARKVQ
jgi:hypothetical protein